MLRADIHTLFDLHLISIDPSTMRVRLHPTLIDSYEGLDGESVRLPTAAAQRQVSSAYASISGSG